MKHILFGLLAATATWTVAVARTMYGMFAGGTPGRRLS